MKTERTVTLISPKGEHMTPIYARKVGRNDPCPCGSGVKSKDCCGTATKYYTKARKK